MPTTILAETANWTEGMLSFLNAAARHNLRACHGRRDRTEHHACKICGDITSNSSKICNVCFNMARS